MVIFHSYVSLPEGRCRREEVAELPTPKISWRLQTILIWCGYHLESKPLSQSAQVCGRVWFATIEPLKCHSYPLLVGDYGGSHRRFDWWGVVRTHIRKWMEMVGTAGIPINQPRFCRDGTPGVLFLAQLWICFSSFCSTSTDEWFEVPGAILGRIPLRSPQHQRIIGWFLCHSLRDISRTPVA